MEMLMLSMKTFEEDVVKAKLPVLMVFGAPWCGYCKRLKPALGQLMGEIEGKLIVGGVDIDAEPELAAKFAVETVPTLMLVRGEQVSEQLINPPSKAKMKEWLVAKGVL